jgi:hypothetical protein
MNRNQLFWGSVLLLLGGLMLAGEMGIRLPNGNSLMSLFWPVLLIGLGVWVMLSVFVQGNREIESARVDLQGAREAKVQVNHGAGELRFHGGALGDELLHGSFVGGVEQNASRNGDRLEVRMRPVSEILPLPPFWIRDERNWDVSLNTSIPTVLDFNLGANKSVIDLHDMTITDFKLKSGASDSVVTLPARGRLKADFEVGAASLTVIVPEGVAVRAKGFIGAGDFHLDKTRFPSGESPDFDTAQNAVEINVRGGAASVKIK